MEERESALRRRVLLSQDEYNAVSMVTAIFGAAAQKQHCMDNGEALVMDVLAGVSGADILECLVSHPDCRD
jgi:hypothetical protein